MTIRPYDSMSIVKNFRKSKSSFLFEKVRTVPEQIRIYDERAWHDSRIIRRVGSSMRSISALGCAIYFKRR